MRVLRIIFGILLALLAAFNLLLLIGGVATGQAYDSGAGIATALFLLIVLIGSTIGAVFLLRLPKEPTSQPQQQPVPYQYPPTSPQQRAPQTPQPQWQPGTGYTAPAQQTIPHTPQPNTYQPPVTPQPPQQAQSAQPVQGQAYEIPADTIGQSVEPVPVIVPKEQPPKPVQVPPSEIKTEVSAAETSPKPHYEHRRKRSTAQGKPDLPRDFVAFDFETANHDRRSVCAAGFVKFKNGREVGSYSTFVKPPEKYGVFSGYNMKIHGIKKVDVQDAPTWQDMSSEVARFIEDLPLVAHNISFDKSCWKQLDEYYGLDTFSDDSYCTHKLSQEIIDGMPDYKLDTLVENLLPTYTLNHHDALSDARACGLLLVKLSEMPKQTFTPQQPGEQIVKKETKRKKRFDPSTIQVVSKALEGQVITATGTLQMMDRKEIREFCFAHGGRYVTSMSKKVTILISGEQVKQFSFDPSKDIPSKLRQALEQGTPIYTEDEFYSFIDECMRNKGEL